MKEKSAYRIVDYTKLIYLPLLISFIAIFAVSLLTNLSSKIFIMNQIEKNGIDLVSQVSNQVLINHDTNRFIEDMLSSKLEIAAKTIFRNREHISDTYLKSILSDLDVDELHWLTPEGKVLYSSIPAYVGWITPDTHPLYGFIHSSEKSFIEAIRPDALHGNQMKFGAFKAHDDFVVQVGIKADTIKSLSKAFQYQSIVDNIRNRSGISYAVFIDAKGIAIADSDINGIGRDYSKDPTISKALLGINSSLEIFDELSQTRVYDFTKPIYSDEILIGVLKIGFNLKPVEFQIKLNAFISVLISLIAFIWFWMIQMKNIIHPLLRLEENISKIDPESNSSFYLPRDIKNTFNGLTMSINSLLFKTYHSIEILEKRQIELNRSNEEIKAAYEQLTASETELRANYDAIQQQRSYIEHLAYHDALTGLPNRLHFTQVLNNTNLELTAGTIMLLDLDNFKEINDTMGHIYGDRILEQIANLFSSFSNKNALIARFGGDEFVIYIPQETNISDIQTYADEILNLLNQDFNIDGHLFNLSFSMGITRFPEDTTDINQLLINADSAMYKVKSQGKSNYMFFDNTILEELTERIEIEQILKIAINENQFELVFQPVISSFSGTIQSFEALLRLKNSTLPPFKFIPIAEETGLIVPIGRWVIEEALKTLADFRKQNLKLKPIAVNFSSRQMTDLKFHEFLADALNTYGISPQYIKLEITESIFLENTGETIEFLNKFNGMGIGMSLDDFGTGYSSINYLTYIPVERVKLDKSLSDKFLKLDNVQVMKSIIDLVHNLNLSIIAEGIEYEHQFQKLKDLGCDYIQGYLFSRPLSKDKLLDIYSKKFF